jgi:hypothetical protein
MVFVRMRVRKVEVLGGQGLPRVFRPWEVREAVAVRD